MILKIGQRWLNKFEINTENITRLIEVLEIPDIQTARCLVLNSNSSNYPVGETLIFHSFPVSGTNQWFEYLIGQDKPYDEVITL